MEKIWLVKKDYWNNKGIKIKNKGIETLTFILITGKIKKDYITNSQWYNFRRL